MENFFKNYFKYFILFALMYVPVFGHLDDLPIRIWDESRLAINAYEMFKDGDFIVTHYGGEPDMWNTKPPLLIWCQAIGMKLFGVNELAVRLPSALSAFFTCVALLIFFQRYLKSFWFGFITIVVLITSHGYINQHASRTGDYDAMLTLFTTLSGLLFFVFCETKKYKFIYLFFLFSALAVLTKSATGLMFLPALFVYALIQKQVFSLLKSKHFYIGLFLFLFLVVGYYLLREANNKGYIAAVLENEWGGRYSGRILGEHHKQGFWYYYNNFIDFQILVWYSFIPCGLLIGLFSKDQKIKRLTGFSFLMLVVFFLVISTAQTKLEWYDAPMYPFLAILIAVFIYYVFQLLNNITWINKTLTTNITPFIFLFVVMLTPYQKILEKTFLPEEYSWDRNFYEISYYLRDAVAGKHNLNNRYFLYEGYTANNLFYLNILNDQGINISIKDFTELDAKDTVLVSQQNVKQYVEEHYDAKELSNTDNVITYAIYGGKK